MVTGVSYYLQTWCIEMRGPMFFAAWTPLCFVFTIFCSSFFLGETVRLGRWLLYIPPLVASWQEFRYLKSALNLCSLHSSLRGSILGGILLIGSLYTMLWGKIKESKTCDGTEDAEKDGHRKPAESCPEEHEQTTIEVKESTSVGASASRVDELWICCRWIRLMYSDCIIVCIQG